MKSPTYYLVRRIVRLAFWLSLLALLYLISTRIWWNNGGLCVGDVVACLKP
jgi:hypothetical protein